MFVTDSWWSAAAVATVACLIAAVYYFSVSAFGKWEKLGVPYVRPVVPLFGNFLKVAFGIEHPVELYRTAYRQLAGHKYGGLFQMRTPYLMIRDPELINNVLIKDFAYFTDRGIYSDFTVNPLSNQLFFMKNPQWRIIRNKLSPAFTSGKIKSMYEQIRECGDRLMRIVDKRLSAGCGNGEMEVRGLLGNYSTDVIGACAFGLRLNAVDDEDDSAFRRYGKTVFQPSLRILLRELCLMIEPVLLKVVRLKDFPSDATAFFHSTFHETIAYRERNNVVRNDFVQTLMQARRDLVLNDDLPPNGKSVYLYLLEISRRRIVLQ